MVTQLVLLSTFFSVFSVRMYCTILSSNFLFSRCRETGYRARARLFRSMTMLVFVLIALVSTATVTADEGSRVVHTAQGPVKGYKDPRGDFYAFYGIPYATAPTGLHKFKAPLAPPVWTEIFEAVNQNVVCPQSPTLMKTYNPDVYGNTTMFEDCLIANLFVPKTEAVNLPVVVYVHGGAFQVAFGRFIIHTSLLYTGKVIIVNFNYRLGAHGFLCLGTEDVPGNAGLKDQVAALRWVKRNIANFGGNPNDVTVAGYSAGAAAVELLLVSKSTQGLFNKVIPESGAGIGVWSIQSDPLEVARSYAHSKGYTDGNDVYVLEEFLKKLPLDVLQDYEFMDFHDSTFMFASCVEREGTDEPFLTDDPVNILKKGNYEKLPVLTGFADMEGMLRLMNFENWKDDMNENFSDYLPGDLQFTDESEREEVARRLKKFYFGDRPISTETVVGYVDYFSDVMFVYPAYRSMSLQVAAGSDSIYLYMYAFVENDSPVPYPGVTGANHVAQTLALAIDSQSISENYRKIIHLLTDVWINFITKGKPTLKGSLAEKVLGGEWLPMSPARPHHVLFNTTSELRGALLPERVELWDEIYSKYYRTPIPPPKPSKKPKSEL